MVRSLRSDPTNRHLASSSSSCRILCFGAAAMLLTGVSAFCPPMLAPAPSRSSSSVSFFDTTKSHQRSNGAGLMITQKQPYRTLQLRAPTMRRKSTAEDAASHQLEASSTTSSSTSRSGSGSNSSEGTPPPFSVTLEADDYSYKEAIQRTLGWVSASTLFGGVLWTLAGPQTGEEFFAGYLVEQSLSVDNLFVFLLLFEYFKVPLQYQDRVLNWGIYGAIVMRGVMIGLGAAALQQFHAILLVFASILIYSSAQFFFTMGDDDDEEEDPGDNSIVKFSKSLIQSSDDFDGKNFFTIEEGVRKATPLFICMIAVEISDVVFAVDSIPAVFGVTENPLVVFSSNLFAIMGLRSLYTILSKAATDLKYLEPAVALVLGFIGSKMVGEYFGYEIPTNIALGVVGTVLTTGVGASVWEKQRRLDQQADSSTAATDSSSSAAARENE